MDRITLEGLEAGTTHDRDVITREVVFAEKLADLHLDEIEKLFVIDHVDFVEENDEGRHTDLTGEKDVLAGLGHRTIGGGNDQDTTVHLGGASDHVLHVVGVAGAIHVSIVAGVGLILDVGGRDGDAALTLFGRSVDLIVVALLGETLVGEGRGDRRGEGRLAVVNVTDRAHVHVRLGAFECCFSHCR